MKLQEKIQSDLKIAMMNKDVPKRDLIRVLIGEINRVGKDVSDDEVSKIVKKMTDNAIEMNNQIEVDILSDYLPKMLTEKEIEDVIDQFISDNNIGGIKQMGLVMKYLKDEFGSCIDGKVASSLIKNKLK
ncbi:GatB/YqeY domain-containing protein [Trichloromonas sp.]|uniref:GatB/YqeY domain-containing protein n=1 Tax=Trichloromonas sp. TaxID=3069249 RepID=UPI002A4B5136|nr:GatB/YqeY domain-containing protein [Trichloromonas sp.]